MPRKSLVAKFLKSPRAAALAHSPLLDTRYPIARYMYIKPIVAMIGGTSALEITRPTTKPHAVPMARVMTNVSTVLEIYSYFQSIPMDIPESARVDMMEMSIPPTSITPSIPRAMTMVTALFFSMSKIDLGVKKDGLITVTIAKSRIRITASSASREPVIFFKTDFFSIYLAPFPVPFSIAISRILSCVASSRDSSPVFRPLHITMILSAIPKISGISEEIRMIA